jgi:hypothetical protein
MVTKAANEQRFADGGEWDLGRILDRMLLSVSAETTGGRPDP